MSHTQQTNTAETYTVEIPATIAPKLVNLLGQASQAENAQQAVWYNRQDREDLARLRSLFADQIADQGGEI